MRRLQNKAKKTSNSSRFTVEKNRRFLNIAQGSAVELRTISKMLQSLGSPYKAMQAIKYRFVLLCNHLIFRYVLIAIMICNYLKSLLCTVTIRKWGFSPALLRSVFAGLKSRFRAKAAKAIICNLLKLLPRIVM